MFDMVSGFITGGTADNKMSTSKTSKFKKGNLGSNGNNGNNGVEKTVQASIGERLWVSKKKDEDFSRLWEVYGVASLSPDKRKVYVADEINKNIWEVPADETLPFDFCHEIDFTDLTRMNYLHEASLLNTLQNRYMADDIYTYFGDTLISINPYYDIPNIYDHKKYNDQVDKNGTFSVADFSNPHVFSIARKSFEILGRKKRSQSIIINGDSGAGKTEAAKQIMRYLVALTKGFSSSSNSNDQLEQLVLESTPVLEAFGNSVTLRNDNSSRFGRFIQIMYNNSMSISGMNTLHFLLEKSRLIRRSPGERNYHIFYQLCATRPNGLKFSTVETYNYLLPVLDSRNYTGTVPDDYAQFRKTKEALLHIGISEDIQNSIWKVLLGVLNLGNVEFARSNNDKYNTGKCVVPASSLKYLELAAECFGISDARDLEMALIQRTIEAGKDGEITVIDLTVDQAKDSRDALAKFLYSAVFDWVVDELNRRSGEAMDKEKRSKKKERFIGILDIFGFEDLEKNSFEQVCVNYANELLQKQFDFYVIESERRIFKDEGVEFPDIVLPSIANSEKVLELLTVHLFNILEEQCLLRSGNDAGFLSNLDMNKTKFGNDKFMLDWKNKNGFVIKHYAGEVSYDSNGFVEKNRDALTTDLKLLIQNNTSNNLEFLSVQIGSSPEERSRKMAARETVLKKFQKDMNNLISTMSKTDQTFIRCIKPNHDQASKEWDVKLVLSQLEYLGIMQAIRVHQDSYPIRREFSFIPEKYYSLLQEEDKGALKYIPGKNDQEVMRKILTTFLGEDSEFKSWQVGYTKVFLGNEVLYTLDNIVNKKRLEKLAKLSEKERMQHLEEERLKQEREVREARERFEREKKAMEMEKKKKELEEKERKLAEEEEQKRLAWQREKDEIQRKLDEERARLKQEREEREAKEKMEREQKMLEMEKRRKDLEDKEVKLLEEEEQKRIQWQRERDEIQKKLDEEKTKLDKMSEQKKKELQEKQRLLEEEEERKKKFWLDEQKKLEVEEENMRKRIKEEEEKLEKQREIRRLLLEEEEGRIEQERQRLVQIEKAKFAKMEQEEVTRKLEMEKQSRAIEEQQAKLLKQQNELSAQNEQRQKEIAAETKRLQAEAEKIEEENRKRKQRLKEEEERLKAQEERLKMLEEDRLLREATEKREREAELKRRKEEEEERLRIKAEQAEKRKLLRKEKKAKAEELKGKKAKLARRKLKLTSATRMQAMIRGAIIRSRYRDMISRKRIFNTVLQPNELVVLSSLVINMNSTKQKKLLMIVTSSKRVLLIQPGSFKITDSATFDPKFCKAVAGGLGGNELSLYLRDEDKQQQIGWKLKDLLNSATTWVAVFDNLYDAPTYIKLGFYKSLQGRVSRKNIVVPVKFGFLKPLVDDEASKRASSRFSITKQQNKGILFLLSEKDRDCTLTWYEADGSIGQLAVSGRMKVIIPDTSTIGGHLNVFVFCLKVKKAKGEKLYSIQARGKDDRDGWVKELRERIKFDVIRASAKKKSKANGENGLSTLKSSKNETIKKKGIDKKKSFNAAQFLQGFQNSDMTTNQNLKHFGSKQD